MKAYEHSRALGWTRIDLILTAFDGIMREMEQGQKRLEEGDTAACRLFLARAQIGVSALIAGASGDDHEISANFRRLYEFVVYCLSRADAALIGDALGVLRVLREGLEAVRQPARDLERAGTIPPADRCAALQVSA